MKRKHNVYFVPENSRLTFLKLSGKIIKRGKYAIYRCSCGTEKEILSNYVNNGVIKSCGCVTEESRAETALRKTTHGLSKEILYRVFRGIVSRCEDETLDCFPRYGGRGVHVCPEWRNNFKAFYDWAIANGWRKGLNIDKDIIPKKLGIPALVYSPEMCSIVTHKENSNTVCNNIEIEYLGRRQNLSQWAEELGLDYRFLWQRIVVLGWSGERALSTPKRTIQAINADRRKLILNTETGIFYFGCKEAAGSTNITPSYLNAQLNGRNPNYTSFIYV